MNIPEEVHMWSAHYPVAYDARNYDPFIQAARSGNREALRKVTEWKNPGRGNPPVAMRLSEKKEKAFQKFLGNLNRYLTPAGSAALRADFASSSPVYAIFWHHVLFGTPIFDVHTNRAFTFFRTGRILKGRTPAISAGDHWNLYSEYSTWFSGRLNALQKQDSKITEREFDRALMQWGIAHQ